jgi:hypothetical protein
VATSAEAKSPNPLIFMALAFHVRATCPLKNGFVTRTIPAQDRALPTISGRTIGGDVAPGNVTERPEIGTRRA